MKIETLQENLHAGLQKLSKVVPSKPQLPVLACVLVTTTEQGISLAATDLYLGIKTTIPGTVSETGSVAIPAKTLSEVVSSLPPGKITLEHKEGSVFLVSSVGKTKIQCLASEEFPAFPVIDTPLQDIETSVFQQIQQTVSFATSIDTSRPVLTSILMRFFETELQVVGTDGFRLSMRRFPLAKSESDQESSSAPAQVLLPTKALNEVVRIASQQKLDIIRFSTSQELKQLYFSLQETEIFVRLIEGEYPPFEKIIPTSFTLEVSFDAQEFQSHLKRALIFARDASNIIKFQISTETLTCSATSSAIGDYTGTLPVTVHQGDEGQIAFNGRYLLDLLSNTKPEKIWFGMSESLKPAMFKIEGLEDFIYVVMPFRVTK